MTEIYQRNGHKFLVVFHENVLDEFSQGHTLDFTNACIISGIDMIKSMKKVHITGFYPKKIGLLLLAEMSSDGNILGDENIRRCVQGAHNPELKDFVCGFICQSKRRLDDMTSRNIATSNQRTDLVYFTPGVHLSSAQDDQGQHYRTIEDAVVKQGCDFIIVGRGITQAEDPEAEAEKYRKEGWECYLRLISKK